jgi:hypothetical protein
LIVYKWATSLAATTDDQWDRMAAMVRHVLGLLESDHIYWYWIGAHDEYDELLNRM